MAKIKSKKTKPASDMEITLTLSFADGQSDDEKINSLLALMKRLPSSVDGCVWCNMKASGVPERLEDVFADIASRSKPDLRLVVDNS